MSYDQMLREVRIICEDNGFPVKNDTVIKIIINSLIMIGQYDDNPVYDVLTKYFKNHTQELEVYRFMKTEHAIQALENRELFSFNLLAQYDNDYGEATEFLSRAGVYKLLAPQQKRIDDATIVYREIDQVKDSIHALCFSKNNTDKMWNEYADGKKGCCLVFKATHKPAFHTRFSDIVYESDDLDNLFKKINLIQKEFRLKLKKELFIPNITYFMCLYKRKSYIWEDEIRFFFQPNKLDDKPQVENIQDKKNRYSVEKKYCKIPFSRKSEIPLNLDLTKVLIGDKVSSYDRFKIEASRDKILTSHR